MKNATETKERPILFSGPMVRAILEGRKTQTRRVIKPSPDEVFSGKPIIPCDKLEDDAFGGRARITGRSIKCPYGQPGDRLWVRETWGLHDTQPSDGPENAQIYYRSTDGERHDLRYQKWRPSIFMPRWASRITLEVVGAGVERVQGVSGFDAQAEGYPESTYAADIMHFGGGKKTRRWFRELWNSINEKRGFGWEKNPWVWVVEFRKCGPAMK